MGIGISSPMPEHGLPNLGVFLLLSARCRPFLICRQALFGTSAHRVSSRYSRVDHLMVPHVDPPGEAGILLAEVIEAEVCQTT